MALRFVRLLAVAIALAVPVQGMAAVTSALCMAFGQHHGTAGHQSHSDDAPAPPGHDHASHSHADEAGGNATDDESSGNASHCGPCTACCASATIAGTGGVSILSSTFNAPYTFSQSVPPSVALDGLDRPPLAL